MSTRTDHGSAPRNGAGDAPTDSRAPNPGETLAEAQLNSLLSLVPDAIITIAEDGTIASFSSAAEKLFGYSAMEVIGRNIKMLMPLPYRDEHDRYLAHYKATGEKKIIGIGRQVEAQRKDGSVFAINLAVNEMMVEGRRMFTGVVHDVSALIEAQSTANRLAQIVEESINEIYVADANTYKIVSMNRAARDNLGYTDEEVADLGPWDFIEAIERENIEQVVAPVRDGTLKYREFETEHRRKDGSSYPVAAQLQFMKTQTPPVYVAIVQDISELKYRDDLLRQSQKMEAVGQLTGGIAHDFNNLLTVVLGNNELLADRLAGDERGRKLLDASTGAAERGAQLTGQLLSFARQQPLDPKVIDLNDLLSGMQDMLQRTLGETITLGLLLSPELGRARADPAQVHNAVLNLSINARDAMPDGGKLIIETTNIDFDPADLSADSEAKAGQFVRLSVSDTGQGMSPEVKARVFEPFFTTKPQGKGTGLGLSMVHGFALQSEGYLDIYSEPGHGTTVHLYLPDASEGAELTTSDAAPSIDKGTGGKMVLVVEDDPRVRHITVARLEHLGYQIIEAENAQDALNVLKEGQPVDLVLTDMVMPGGMTGADLVQQILQKYPNMKVVFTSGYAEGGQMQIKGVPWLRKPYKIGELACTLRQLLD